MITVYALEEPPVSFTSSLFLAGPSPRKDGDPNWREEALETLRGLEYEGVVFVPLPRDGVWAENYEDQVEWETQYLNMADVIVFWVPRKAPDMLALTTNVEYGLHLSSGKCVLGYPPDAEHMRYLDWHAQEERVPVSDTLKGTLENALFRINWGALRTGGEREVPLHIWNLRSFQEWYKSQTGAGNRLDGAKVVWTFRVGPKKTVFFWALHVNMWIEAEGRSKENEIALSRPDVSVVVAYHLDPKMVAAGYGLLEVEVVLIREFRSPASTPTGYITELPGGSSWKADKEPVDVAAEELHEETGLEIDPSRFRLVDSRQVAGTLSAHHATVYAVKLTEEEMSWVKEHIGDTHGVAEDTERTYLEVMTVGELLKAPVDWSVVGMIMTALMGK